MEQGRASLPAPRGTPRYCAMSRKDTFAKQCLGLSDLGDEECKRVHDAIWADVSEIQKELVAPGNLERNLKENPKDPNKPAYSDIREGAIEQAVEKIYTMARPEVKAWYDHWISNTEKAPLNKKYWFLNWFLYASFRYRDYRNGGRRKTGSGSKPFRSRKTAAGSSSFTSIGSATSAVASPLQGPNTQASPAGILGYAPPTPSAADFSAPASSAYFSDGRPTPSLGFLAENRPSEQEMHEIFGLKYDPVRDRHRYDPARDAFRKTS